MLDLNLGSKTSPQIIKIRRNPSKEERDELEKLLRELKDVFACSYDDLKAYSPEIIQHTIPLKEGAKPVKQKLRQIIPKLAPLVKEELQKMVDSGIITPIRHSSWISNPVITHKKTGNIRMCIDFRDLNRGCLKYNYPLRNMENLLQRITRSQMISFLDGFSEYNQVIVKEEDHLKTAFTTPWGTYIDVRMPFGLLNAGSTFQRAMIFFQGPHWKNYGNLVG